MFPSVACWLHKINHRWLGVMQSLQRVLFFHVAMSFINFFMESSGHCPMLGLGLLGIPTPPSQVHDRGDGYSADLCGQAAHHDGTFFTWIWCWLEHWQKLFSRTPLFDCLSFLRSSLISSHLHFIFILLRTEWLDSVCTPVPMWYHLKEISCH